MWGNERVNSVRQGLAPLEINYGMLASASQWYDWRILHTHATSSMRQLAILFTQSSLPCSCLEPLPAECKAHPRCLLTRISHVELDVLQGADTPAR